MKRMLLEALGLFVVALALGMTWNKFNENGITPSRDLLGRDHKKPETTTPGSVPPTQAPPKQPSIGAAPPEDPKGATPAAIITGPDGADDWDESGLHFISLKRIREYLDEPGTATVLDARKDKEYKEGHIPGAYNLYHATADQHLPALRETLDEAPYIVIYCGGGDCDDSKDLAEELTGAYEFDRDRIQVYHGGFNEWSAQRLPIEQGERAPKKSGEE